MTSVLEALGLEDQDAAFKRLWTNHGIPAIQRGKGEKSTPAVQSLMAQDRKTWDQPYAVWDAKEETHKVAPREKRGFKGMVSYRLRQVADHALGITGKAGEVDRAVVEDHTPLVFDPDVMDTVKAVAPLAARVGIEGQPGYKAVVNRIDQRDKTLGFINEASSLNLLDEDRSKFSMSKLEQEMKITADLVTVSDFSSAATAHYPGLTPLRETTLGTRLREWAQHEERAYLYGDPTNGHTERGSPFKEHGYRGLATIYEDAGVNVDKSGVDLSGTDSFLKNIKAELKTLLQGDKAVELADLEIWTSHTAFDVLENEMEVRRRVSENQNSVNYGFEFITISGVPVFASHNVRNHSFGAVDKGHEGDVFIVNSQAIRKRALAPMFTVPLAKRGFSEEVALGEFGAFLDRADGNLGKYLQAYPVT